MRFNEAEIASRRTFAVIAHPDAGKTTLTEKLLLFGGAIHVAGAVKSNKIRKTAAIYSCGSLFLHSVLSCQLFAVQPCTDNGK